MYRSGCGVPAPTQPFKPKQTKKQAQGYLQIRSSYRTRCSMSSVLSVLKISRKATTLQALNVVTNTMKNALKTG